MGDSPPPPFYMERIVSENKSILDGMEIKENGFPLAPRMS